MDYNHGKEKNMKATIVTVLLVLSFSVCAGGVPNNIVKQIKADAKVEWPKDYNMQLYEINNQKTAYISLDKLKRKGAKGVPFNIVKEITKKAKAEWPRDYTMQLYETENQIKAYKEIN